MEKHAFVSYSHSEKDAGYVETLVQFLQAEGVVVWFDREIPVGDRWEDTILRSLDSCSAFIVVMTPDAAESPWVAREVDRASAFEKPIRPLLLMGSPFPSLAEVQYEPVAHGSMPSARYVDDLRRLLRGSNKYIPLEEEHLDGVRARRLVPVSRLHDRLRSQRAGTKAVCVSPDSSRVVGAGDDRVYVWALDTGELIRALAGHDRYTQVWAVSISPDGTHLASAGVDRTVRLWQADTGRLSQSLLGHRGWVYAVAHSPDRVHLASASYDRSVRIWNGDAEDVVHCGDLVRVLKGHDGPAMSVTYSPDGRELATGDASGKVRLWRTDSGRRIRTLRCHTGAVRSISYRPDGAELATTGEDGRVRVWHPQTGRQLRDHDLKGSGFAVAYAPDSESLAGAGLIRFSNDKVSIWRTDTGDRIKTLTCEDACAVAYTPDGSAMVAGSKESSVLVWRAALLTGC